MSNSSVPDVTFGLTGLVVPTEAEILAGVQADMNAAFGGNLNPALETPQGQLASSTAAIIGDKNSVFLEYVNQVDPDFADGRMQDAIARIYFLDRNPAEPTVVQATCIGLAGTVIPVGALTQAGDGNIYSCTQAGTIPVSGTITLSFACLVTGPISCPAGTLTKIYQAIPGWDTVNNADDGVIGAKVETRAEFEYRRAQSVALNATGSLPAIYANVFAVAGVLDVYATENTKSVIVNAGATSYPLAPHSVYIAAVGGAAADIAQAIWLRKDVGADYNGNTSVVVTDQSGYNVPYPSYTVKFEIPVALPILFAVQLASNASLPSNIVALVQQAIITAFSGADGGTRARIASTIFASRYYAPISAISPAVEILSVLIGTSTPTLNAVAVGIDQVPTINASNIAVTLV